MAVPGPVLQKGFTVEFPAESAFSRIHGRHKKRTQSSDSVAVKIWPVSGRKCFVHRSKTQRTRVHIPCPALNLILRF